MRKLFILFLSIIFLLSSTSLIEAAKKATPTPKKTTTKQSKPAKKKPALKKSTKSKKSAPAKKAPPKTASGSKITGSDITVSYKVQGGSVVVTFSNLKNVRSLSYTLIYSTNGQQEGAVGTATPKGANTASRTLLFGTCSKNVCRYHSNITDVSLEVSAKLKSGKTVTKTYYIPY